MTVEKRQLVIGLGEVGEAIQRILNCDGYDITGGPKPMGKYDVLHICIPWSQKFISIVKSYQKYLKKKGIVIIHSTVPVGTSKKLGAVHSPIRGIHPYLYDGIRTFVKYFGGRRAMEAARSFIDLDIECVILDSSDDTEALKLWDTTIYGANILLEKEIAEYCKKHKLSFYNVYTHPNETYNIGYQRLGYACYKKYVLQHIDGKIGGHCIVNNAKMLKSESAKRILDFQNKK